MSEPILRADGVFRWYAPSTAASDNSRGVAGTLEIAVNGISTLSLVGLLLDDSPAETPFVLKRIDAERCIFGVLKDNRYVFLRRIEIGGMTLGNSLSHQKYMARDALVFHHLDDWPNLNAVTNLQIGLAALDDWASEPTVVVKKTQRGATVRAQKPKTRTFKLPGKTLRLKTNIRYTAPTDFYLQSATLKQETFLEVEPRQSHSLDSIREEFRLLEDLLLLLADVDVVLPWPTVRYGGQAALYYFERRRSDPQKVDILKSWAALKWPTTSLGTLLSNLEAQQDILGPGLYLYLGIRRSPALYLENKFSTAIFGLESLHRRVGTSAAQAKLEAKIARIISDVKLQKDRDWLSGRLRNAGEPSLEERLFLTFSELEIGLEPKGLRAFAKECADVRNQIAHFGGQRDGDYDLFVQRMYTLNEAVRPLYHAVLLNRIGLDRSRIQGYFHRSPYARERERILRAAGLTFTAPSPQE
ncbi:HEPN domain-containing protein [Ralstonia sp. 22111]|uniref:HEPN domain-containing protein n=1 Tax=Ralstonia sp. 22111 TaxID=3453878 RepID=UPI003F852CCD